MHDTINRDQITPEERAEARRYALVIEWSDENDAYLVTAPDLSGLATDGSTPAEAAAMGEEAVVTWLASLRKWGQPIPDPSFSALPDHLRPEAYLAPASARTR